MADQEIEVKISPEVIKLHKKYKFFQDSYDGGQAYKDGKYLIRHKREKDENFKLRLERASFMNFCAPVIDVNTSYLFREEPTRDLKKDSTAVDDFLVDADLEGRPWNKVVRELSKLAGAMGAMGVIVDKPKGKAISRAEELKLGIRPYVAIYNPRAILYWEFERIGGIPTLTKLILQEGEAMELLQIVVWTLEEWAIYKKKEKTGPESNKFELVDSEANELKRIPFALLRNRDSFKKMTGLSDIADIADVNRRIYYLDSDSLEIIENCGFPILEGSSDALNATGGDGEEIDIGTESVLDRGDEPESGGFRFVEAPHTSLEAILKWYLQAIENIKYLAKIGSGDAQTSGQAESGAALELRFQQLNALLCDKAENCESFEKTIFELIGLWEKEEIDIEITYPRKFGVRDLAHDLDVALSAQLVVQSRTFSAVLSDAIARRVLPNDTPEEVLKKIEEELKQSQTLPGSEEDGKDEDDLDDKD